MVNQSTMARYGAALRIYDNGGKTADRFTLIPPRWAAADYREGSGLWHCFGCNSEPFHPQGIGMHGAAAPGPHLGRRISWDALPADVQRAARQSFPDFCPPEMPAHYSAAELDTMARHYLIACIWADAPEGTRPRETEQARTVARARCARFLGLIGPEMLAQVRERESAGYGAHPDCGTVAPVFAAMGHDLYLTSAGHGVGFWDRDALAADELGGRLSAFCGWRNAIGEPNPEFYRGWVYFMVGEGD